jgi:hypothetical protein
MVAPYLEFTTFRSSYLFFYLIVAPYRLKELQIVVNSKYMATMSQYGATKIAAECLMSKINSKCKIATLRRENRKIQYDNEI